MEEFRITGAHLNVQPFATGPKAPSATEPNPASLQAVKDLLFSEGPESGLMKRVRDLEGHAGGINDLGMGFCNPSFGGYKEAKWVHAPEVRRLTEEALAQVECALEIVAPDGNHPDPVLLAKLNDIRQVLRALQGSADAVMANGGGVFERSGTSLPTWGFWDNLRNQVQFLQDLKLQ